MTDFTAKDEAGGTLAIDWADDGGARIRVGGNQPMDQPACSIKRSREEMAGLRDHLDEELGPPARSRREYLEDQLNELANAYTGNPFRDGKINARINELTQELATLRSRPRELCGWQPIETAPHILDRDYKLLLWWPHWRTDRPVVGYWTSYHGGWRADEALAADGVSPTHWMPLPTQPCAHAKGG